MDREQTPAQRAAYDIIFGAEPGLGRGFDIALIILILASVGVVLLDSIPEYHTDYGDTFLAIEWGFTLLFTLEYGVRLWCSPNRWSYARSAFGIVDLLAILPTYLAIVIPNANSLLLIRLFRILRIFRILRLFRFLSEANVLVRSLRNARRKIFVFFSMMLVLMTIFGCLMYVVEGPEHGYDNIPLSIYWAIVTITTVGYGDVVPQTPLGQTLAAVGMLIGYAIIAVPTGILTAELATEINRERSTSNCPNCERTGHEPDADFCKYCGGPLGNHDH